MYSLTTNPWTLVALQALDGIGAGIYGVVIVAMCADLTRGRGRFNALQGLIATALSVGGVIGPLSAGFLVQHLGFAIAFDSFAVVAAVAATLFVGWMPETRRQVRPVRHWGSAPSCQFRARRIEDGPLQVVENECLCLSRDSIFQQNGNA